MILGSQGERLGVSHGLKTLIVFGSQQRLYIKVPSHWTTRKNLQEEKEEKKKKLTTLSCPLRKHNTGFHYFARV